MEDDPLSFLGVNPSDPEPSSTPPEGTAPPADMVAFLFRRYSDAYTEAHAVVAIGKLVKGIGAFLAIASIVLGLLEGQQQYGNGVPYLIGGFVLACVIGVPIYVLGILVAAQGQTALATLDNAVNNSRHLSDNHVARILLKRWSL